MPIPSTGTDWRGSGAADVDGRFNTRGGLAAILIRNNRGAATNISPWVAGAPPTIGWSPFAADGQLRNDLFAAVRINGEWQTNPSANEGFYLIGALTEDGGPERAPNISQDSQMILQSNAAFDVDITEEGMAINFTGVETLKPVMKRLRMNLPLQDGSGNSIVEDPGQENFSIGKPVDTDGTEYQIILLFARKKGGKYIYTAEGYSLCKLSDIGNFRRSKTDPDAGSLGYTVLPDPFLMTKDPSNPSSNTLIPALYVEWIAGPGWTAIGGAPVFVGTPTGAPAGATGATITTQITGPDPFAITVQRAVSPYTAFTNATIANTSYNAGTNTTTLTISGLTTATAYKFKVIAKGSNGQTTESAQTAIVTTT